MRRKAKYLFFIFITGLFIFGTNIANAKKPPWAGDDWNPANPPSAPEPLSLTLIGMAASGVTGYIIGKRKKK